MSVLQITKSMIVLNLSSEIGPRTDVVRSAGPLLALSEQSDSTRACPLLDNSGQRSILAGGGLSAFDPKRTSAALPTDHP